MAEIKMAVSKVVKSGPGVRIYVPEMVAEAAGLEPGNDVGLYVDPKLKFGFVVRKMIKVDYEVVDE